MSRVIVFLAEGFEEIEALTPVDLCRRAKIDVTTVSIGSERQVTGARGIHVVADTTFDEADLEKADMLVLPGGMPGTKNLEACEKLMKLVESFANDGKRVAAICAAPTILGHMGLLEGKKACCYPGLEGELAGAKVTKKSVTVDGNIITSRGMGTATDFALAIIEVLTDKKTADTIANQVVYK